MKLGCNLHTLHIHILGLIAFNVFGGKNSCKIDESLANSNAILPFRNLSGDHGQDLICEGLTEEVINNLYKVEAFDRILIQDQLYKKLVQYNHPRKIAVPPNGWIYSIRQGFNMSLKQLGNRLSITPQIVTSFPDKETTYLLRITYTKAAPLSSTYTDSCVALMKCNIGFRKTTKARPQ
jgi:hypothetical protein